MNKIKKIIPSLLLTLIVAACQQVAVIAVPTTTSIPATLTQIPTFTPAVTTDPTSELVPYYGTPQPAKVIINGKTYDSEIGTTQWISINADGDRVMEIGDAFAIITPKESIPITSKFSFILRLPISVNPTELWYAIFAVTENEIAAQSSKDSVYRWQPNYKEQPSLPLLVEQQLNFSLESGIYVLEVHAGWGGTPPHTELEADYGFLLEVQE